MSRFWSIALAALLASQAPAQTKNTCPGYTTGNATIPSGPCKPNSGGGGSGKNIGTAIGIGILGAIIYNEYRKKKQVPTTAPAPQPSAQPTPQRTPPRQPRVPPIQYADCGPKVPVSKLPDIATIQNGLNTLGFGPFAVDGDLGPKTCSGIAEYLGIPAYGPDDVAWDALATKLDQDVKVRLDEEARPPEVGVVENPWGPPGNLAWGDFVAPPGIPPVGVAPAVQIASLDIPDRSMPRFRTPPEPFNRINVNRTMPPRTTSFDWTVALVLAAALLALRRVPKKPPVVTASRIRHTVHRDVAPHLDCLVPHSVSVMVAFRPDQHPTITMLTPIEGMAAE